MRSYFFVVEKRLVTEGYFGSYSLLQQHCLAIRPSSKGTKRTVHKIKRKTQTNEIWSNETNAEDLVYIIYSGTVITASA